MLIFLISVGVVLRLHSRDPEGGDGIADMVQTERGARPHKSRASPRAGDLLVHGRNRPVVCHRHWSSGVAQEFLRGEERLCGSHHLELIALMLPQKPRH